MPTSTPPRILVLEDDPASLRAMCRLLQFHGYDPVEACSVRQALQVVNGQSYGILDLMLPDGNGLEVLAEIHAHHPQMRVMLLTGMICPPSHAEAQELGAELVMQKPVSIPRMLTWLQSERP